MGETTRAHVPDDLRLVRSPSDPALSPDGSRVVYVLHEVDGDANTRSLWSVGREGVPRRLTRGGDDTSPRFSPDGRTIAFLRGGQLWLLPVDGGEPEAVTDLAGGAGVPVWSPDGGRIAFAALVGGTGPDEPIVASGLVHKMDGAGRLRGAQPRLHVLDLADRSVRRVTDGPQYAGVPAWSPDGTRLAFADWSAIDRATPAHVVDLATSDVTTVGDGAVRAVVWLDEEPLLISTPTAGIHNNRLVRGSVDLTAGLDRNVMPGGGGYPGALPQSTGSALLFCARDNGCTHLYEHRDGAIRKLVGGDQVVSGLSVAGDTAVVVVSTVDHFGEVAFVDTATGELDFVTSYVEDFADVRFAKPQARSFTVSDGVEVHGWLLRSPATTGPSPLLVDVHGGPHNAWSPVRDAEHLYHQVLVERGWSVLLLNPRASDGYGEEFLRAAIGGWGTADENDFLEPVDALVAEGLVDPDRLALTGYSYGGYMSCWLPTRTGRFRAVVAGGVVSDLVSMGGTSDVGTMIAAIEIGDPGLLGELSPITHAHKVSSPTLVLHGAADERCPVGQAEQWYHALLGNGVKTELVLYPDGDHLFILDGTPSHRVDYNRRLVDWVVAHTGGPDEDRS
ncbi:S9 family peptidase [Actinosynnema sp. NPDC050436]|uniref:S9 family peptidase n=1 Tax=Actinosynnema sp. NPDC050436 TaxID=3155659 RepID=UPI0033F2CAA4